MEKTVDNRKKVRSRDPERTKAQILEAALTEFAEHGYDGAKIQKIAKSAACNPRLIYHYFGSKDDLYLAALRQIYSEIRAKEVELNLDALPPQEAILKLAEFTFDFFDQNGPFVKITRNENLLGGHFVRQLSEITDISNPLIDKISDLLQRGIASRVFRAGIDPLQLYISIVALSAHHINATHTLSATFGTDCMAPEWRRTRREHVVQMVSAALTIGDSPG